MAPVRVRMYMVSCTVSASRERDVCAIPAWYSGVSPVFDVWLSYSYEHMLQRAHRIKLKPNKVQEEYFRKACGVARFAYNWSLSKWNDEYAIGITGQSGWEKLKQFNAIRKVEFPWTYEVTKWAGQNAIENLGEGFRRFFKKRTQRPKFKKKGYCRDSFYIGVAEFCVKGKRLRIPHVGEVKMLEKLRFSGRAMSVVISREGSDWYASISVRLDGTQDYPHKCQSDKVVGIDLGLKEFAVFSDGTRIARSHFTKKSERKLAKAQRAVHRKILGSKNREKAKAKVSNICAKTARKRQNFLHNETAKIVRSYKVVGLETLNLRGMAKTKRAKDVHDVSLYDFKRKLDYKSQQAGSHIVEVSLWFPSTKMCSACGLNGKKIPLGIREWICIGCNTVHDRDLNAAVN